MTDTAAELRARTAKWDDAAKARLVQTVKQRQDANIQLWYCDRPPHLRRNFLGELEYAGCDGQPHEGFPYKHARAKQWPPPNSLGWRLWLVMSGRGWGKTRVGANWLRKVSEKVERTAMVGRRGVDVRGTMVEGDSGLIKVCEAAQIGYEWFPSKKEFHFANGHIVYGYSAEEPDSLRGPQHGAGWWDEPAHMPLLSDCWSNYKFGLRLPGMPGGTKTLATSTPLPIDWLDEQMELETTFVTRGSTFENEDNLDPDSVSDMRKEFEGTTKGRQELHGEIIRTVEGALWNVDMLRYDTVPLSGWDRIVIGVDPAGTANRRSDKTGIVVVAKKGDYYWVLEDKSGKYSPKAWGALVVSLYVKWEADCVVVERNFGADMVGEVLRHATEESGELVRVKETTATRSKQLRAEPIVMLYEQKRVSHVHGLTDMEKEMTTWVPGKGDSPNAVDALVWAVTDLAKLGGGPAAWAKPKGRLPNRNDPRRGLPWSR